MAEGAAETSHAGNGSRFNQQLVASAGFQKLVDGQEQLRHDLVGTTEEPGMVREINTKLDVLQGNPAIRFGSWLGSTGRVAITLVGFLASLAAIYAVATGHVSLRLH